MYPGRLDEKGRLTLPAALRKYVDSLPEKKLFVTSIDRRTAAIYPIAAWRANEQIFDSYSANPKAARTTAYTAARLGSEVEMDGQGRVLLNSTLREAVRLDGQLQMFGYRGHIEVLPEHIAQEFEQESVANAASAADTMREAGLR